MKDTLRQPTEEDVAPFQVVRGDGPCVALDEEPIDHDDRTEQEKAEAFWAGRNMATRLSARVAA